jgi:hypothetical protein
MNSSKFLIKNKLIIRGLLFAATDLIDWSRHTNRAFIETFGINWLMKSFFLRSASLSTQTKLIVFRVIADLAMTSLMMVIPACRSGDSLDFGNEILELSVKIIKFISNKTK